MRKYRLIFYDYEVFSQIKDPKTGKSFWLLVLCDYETKKGKVIVNDENMLKKYYEHFKNDIWVGYNSRQYDSYIQKAILLGYDPGYVNDQIILHNKKGYEVVKYAWKIPLNNYDISDGTRSLKELEGFMGMEIKESSVPFDIDRPLTQYELDEVIKYCLHDVKATMKVFENRIDDFNAQMGLLDMFNLDLSYINKTKAQLSAIILGAERHDDRGDEFNFSIPNTIKLEKYKYIREWFENPNNKRYTIEVPKKSGKGTREIKNQLVTNVAGIEHIFGFGGVHAAIPKFIDEGIILSADVSSLYPSIMINYSFLSRNVKEPEKFKEIRDKRLELKKKGDSRQESLKLVINGTYGASKDQYNALYDPRQANNVCIAGQLLLVDLIEKLEPYCKLIQSNTDGIFIKVEKEENVEFVKSIAKEWEERTGLALEWARFQKIYQKDVNNYIVIPEKLFDEKGKPKWKSKGAYVKKLKELDYDLPIVNKALVNYFVFGTSIEETINNCDELREFQKITKVSSKYLYAQLGDQKLREKVNRVFADKRPEAKGIYKAKYKQKGGEWQISLEKIENTPERVFIDNGNIIEKRVPDYLDKEWYIELAKKRLKDFIGE